AAAPAPHSESSGNSGQVPSEPPKSVEPGTIETQIHVSEATQEAPSVKIAKAESAPPASADDGNEASGKAGAEAASDEEPTGSEEMSKLMEQYDEQHEAAAQNEIVEVKVVAYTEQGVVVDLGGKTEGLIPAAEFSDADVPRPEPNSTIEVQRTGEHKEGYAVLSYLKVLRRRAWEKLDAAFKAKETLTSKVVDRIKGGLVVDVGVRAFLPGSQYDLKPVQNLDLLLGQEIQVRITKLNRRRGNIVVSRRALLE